MLSTQFIDNKHPSQLPLFNRKIFLEMAGGKEKGSVDLYAVMGLGKECTSNDLKFAYKKLAMRWHPDRCSASGNSKMAEEAKRRFQAIQEAYSVLSDHNKRLLYDVGMYDKDDDDNNNGMGDFLSEMADMMSQTNPTENGEGTFEEFQQLFDNIFHSDTQSFASSSSSYSNSASRNGANPKRNSFKNAQYQKSA